MKFFVDTNIFIRFLQADHKIQSPKCKRLFEKAVENKVKLITNSMVIAEIVWVLNSFFELSKQDIIKKIKTLLLFNGVEIPEKNLLVSTLNLFEKYNLDFIDAYCLCWIKQNKINSIYSFDRDFDKLEGIKRIEPE